MTSSKQKKNNKTLYFSLKPLENLNKFFLTDHLKLEDNQIKLRMKISMTQNITRRRARKVGIVGKYVAKYKICIMSSIFTNTILF